MPRLGEQVNEQLKSLLDQSVIEPSTSSFSSPLIDVSKSDGKSILLCIDYRHLNSMCIPQACRIPHINETLDVIGVQIPTIFSSLYLNKGFFQCDIHPDGRPYTIFISKSYGPFQFNRVPKGYINSPGAFQYVMDALFRHAQNKYLVAYIDDLLIYSPSIELHYSHVREVYTLIRNAGLTLNKEKLR